VSCQLNRKLLNSAPPNIVYTEFNRIGILMINNWTTLNLKFTRRNTLECEVGIINVQQVYYATFFSLSK